MCKCVGCASFYVHMYQNIQNNIFWSIRSTAHTILPIFFVNLWQNDESYKNHYLYSITREKMRKVAVAATLAMEILPFLPGPPEQKMSCRQSPLFWCHQSDGMCFSVPLEKRTQAYTIYNKITLLNFALFPFCCFVDGLGTEDLFVGFMEKHVCHIGAQPMYFLFVLRIFL